MNMQSISKLGWASDLNYQQGRVHKDIGQIPLFAEYGHKREALYHLYAINHLPYSTAEGFLLATPYGGSSVKGRTKAQKWNRAS